MYRFRYGVTAEMIANHLLPFSVPMSVLPSLNSEQVTTVLAICRTLLKAVHDERIEALKETESMQDAAKETVGIANGGSARVDVGNVFEQDGPSPVFDVGAAARAAAQADQEAEKRKEAEAIAAAARVADAFVTPAAGMGAQFGDGSGAQFKSNVRDGGEDTASLFGAASGGSTRSPRTQRKSRAYKGVQTADDAVIGSSMGAFGQPTSQLGNSAFGATQSTSNSFGAPAAATLPMFDSSVFGGSSSTGGSAQTSQMGTPFGGGSVFGSSPSSGGVFGGSPSSMGGAGGMPMPSGGSVFGGSQGAAYSTSQSSMGGGMAASGAQGGMGGFPQGTSGMGAGPSSGFGGMSPFGQPQQSKPQSAQGNLLDLGFPSSGSGGGGGNSGSLI
jgi:hypothetical protein